MVGDAGIMIAPDDLNGAVKAMATLLHIPEQQQEYIPCHFDRTKHFRWDFTAEVINVVTRRSSHE